MGILGLIDYLGAPTNFGIPFKLYGVISLAVANGDVNNMSHLDSSSFFPSLGKHKT